MLVSPHIVYIYGFSRPFREYMTQADPSHSVIKVDTKITQKEFFYLCTCRQLNVRRLLEALGSSQVNDYLFNDDIIYYMMILLI